MTCYDRQSGGDEVTCCTDGTIIGTPDSSGDWKIDYYNKYYTERPDSNFAAPQCSIASTKYYTCSANGTACVVSSVKTPYTSPDACVTNGCPAKCESVKYKMPVSHDRFNPSCSWQLNWECASAPWHCPGNCPTYKDIKDLPNPTLVDVCKMMYSCDESGTCNPCQSRYDPAQDSTFQKSLDTNNADCFKSGAHCCANEGGGPFEWFSDFCKPDTSTVCKLT